MTQEIEQAFGILMTLGVTRERARSVPNGILVLDQRYAREVAALHAEIDRLKGERDSYRALAGYGLNGTDEADELAKITPIWERDAEALRRLQERSLALMKACANVARATGS